MWFLGCLLVIFVVWCVWYPVGRHLAGLVPARYRPATRLYFAPALGLAVFVLLAEPTCWLVPLAKLPCGFILLGIGVVAWWRLPDRRLAAEGLVWLCIFSVIASFPILAPVLRYHGYNPCNDTFGYLEHAQWLQDHAFREPARPTEYYPYLTQIALMQRLSDRMGASFVLAWIQASFGFPWSFEVYPVLVGSLLTAGALATAGLVAVLARCRRRIAIPIGVLAVMLPGGFRFGAIWGFLHQTAGLVFCIVTPLLFAAWLASPPAGTLRRSVLSMLPVAILLAAGTACYFALLPFVALALLITVCGSVWLCRSLPWREQAKKLFVLALITGGLLHVETYRAYFAIRFDLTAVVGNPVRWSLAEFLGHAVGVHTGAWELSRWVLGGATVSLGVALSLFAIGIWMIARRRITWILALPYAAFLGIGAVLFLKFHYSAQPPPEWSFSWSAFKTVEYMGPIAMSVCGIGLVGCLRLLRGPARLGEGGLLILAAVLLAANYTDAERSTYAFLNLAGTSDRPFENLLALRRFFETTPRDTVINLDIQYEDHKLRQLMLYFLRDHRLLSNWSTDSYLSWLLPNNGRIGAIPEGAPRVFVYPGRRPLNLPTFGRIAVDLEDRDHVEIAATKSTFGREEDASGWWHWVDHRIDFSCESHSRTPTELRLKAWVYQLVPTAPVHCEIRVADRLLASFVVQLASDGRAVDLPTIPVPAGVAAFQIAFYCEGQTQILSPRDDRKATFMLKNLSFTPSPPSGN